MYNNGHNTNLNETKDNNKCYNDNMVLKTDPYQDDVSADKEHKKFQINGPPCQMKNNLQILVKFWMS